MMSFGGGCAIYSASLEVEHRAITRPSHPKKLAQNTIVDSSVDGAGGKLRFIKRAFSQASADGAGCFLKSRGFCVLEVLGEWDLGSGYLLCTSIIFNL